MRNIRDSPYIRDIGFWVADRLDKNRASFIIDKACEAFGLGYFSEAHGYSHTRKGLIKKVNSAAVNLGGGDYLVALSA
jgi:hypothetical protein